MRSSGQCSVALIVMGAADVAISALADDAVSRAPQSPPSIIGQSPPSMGAATSTGQLGSLPAGQAACLGGALAAGVRVEAGWAAGSWAGDWVRAGDWRAPKRVALNLTAQAVAGLAIPSPTAPDRVRLPLRAVPAVQAVAPIADPG